MGRVYTRVALTGTPMSGETWTKIVEVISPILFKDDGTAVFAVLDGGSIPGLLEKLHAVPRLEFVCLYAGEIKPELAKVAPYLVRLEPNSEFAKWVLREGWGKHWGVFVVAPADFLAMRRHLRRFLIVHTTDGKTVLLPLLRPARAAALSPHLHRRGTGGVLRPHPNLDRGRGRPQRGPALQCRRRQAGSAQRRPEAGIAPGGGARLRRPTALTEFARRRQPPFS